MAGWFDGAKGVAPKLLIAAIVVATAAAALIALLYPVLAMPFEISRNYNEGWNAYHTVRAQSGLPLYLPRDALFMNNYPPLSFVIVGGAMRWFGDPIMIGRVLALAGLVVTTINVGAVVYRLTGACLVSVLAGIVFIGVAAGAFTNYIAMNDPQWLAHGVMTTGLVLFLYGRSRPGWIVLAAVTMVAAGLIKHNLVPLPLAVTVWCWLYARDLFRVWLISAVVAAAGGVAWIVGQYGLDAFWIIADTPRTYFVGRAATQAFRLLTPLAPIFAMAGAMVIWCGMARNVRLILLYLIFGAIWRVFNLGGEGVSYNAIFDVYIAAVIVGAASVHALSSADAAVVGNSVLVRVLCFLVLASPVFFVSAAYAVRPDLAQLWDEEREEKALIQAIAREQGPVLCETLALCFWAGKPMLADFFSLGQKIETGALDGSDFIARINRREFALIQENLTYVRLAPSVRQAIDANYEASATTSLNRVLLRPKRTP